MQNEFYPPLRAKVMKRWLKMVMLRIAMTEGKQRKWVESTLMP